MNMKHFAIFAIIIGTTASIFADPRLHFKNKSNHPIELGLIINNAEFINLGTIEPGWATSDDFPMEKKAKIVIFCKYCPEQKYTAEVPANKTIYVKWDGITLQPQLGTLRGILGTTTTGYSLKNNVQQSDIKK